MKCARCGTELKPGCLYCSVCGQEAQMVPDYNLLDDELVDALSEKKINRKKETEVIVRKKRSRQKKKLAGLICAAAAAGVLLAAAVFSYVSGYGYQMRKGESYLADQKYNAAASCFEKCIAKEPEQPDAYLLIAEALQNAGSDLRAVSYLEQLLDFEPDNADAYRQLVEIYESTQNYGEIIALRDAASAQIQDTVFGGYFVSAPEFSESAGVYEDDMDLFLTADDGTDIFYTTDGSSPVEQGTAYHADTGIHLTEGVTFIRAVCRDERGIYSDVAEGEFEIAYREPDMPVVAPDSGTFTEPQTIHILVPDGCTAYYTWDKTIPDENSAVYTGAIEVPQGNNVLSVVLIDQHGLSSSIFRGNYVYMP